MGAEIEDIEIRLFLEAIHAKYGYDMRDYARESMRRRVLAALAKSGSPHLGELQHRLLHDPALFASLLDVLTVQVTEMFRDPAFYRAFRSEVIPLLRTYPQLKIWHAGCASGEEVYATAILLAEEDLYSRSQIYATDISAAAVAKAREGVYPLAQSENFAKNYVAAGGRGRFEDHCSTAYERLAVRENLRKNVVFFQHDLVSDYGLGEMHVIFCRNVFIYFSAPLRDRVFEMFSQSLPRGGFLCLGNSEALPPSSTRSFAPVVAAQRIFRFRGAS